MINYATDSNTRTITYGVLMAIAIAVQYAVTPFVAEINQALHVNLTSPASFLIFTLLFVIYDNFIWKLHIGRLSLSMIPNFSGEWIGYIERRIEFEKHEDVYIERRDELIAVEMGINQTYRRISIR